MIAQLGFRQKYGWKAVPVVAIAGIAPDWDVVTKIIHEPWFWSMHHALGHSFLAVLIMATLVGSLSSYLLRLPYLPLMGWSFIAGVTHGLCDMPYFWGIQWLWPFSTMSVKLNCLNYLDLIVLGTWLGSAWWLYRKPDDGFKIATTTLTFMVLYIAARAVLPTPNGILGLIMGGWIYAPSQQTPLIDWW